MSNISSPAVKETGIRAKWKLLQRYRRLCNRADEARGECMNLVWLAWASAIFDCLQQLLELGVDMEDVALLEMQEKQQ